ncbi:unnamed protein product [Victoria cruziana]
MKQGRRLFSHPPMLLSPIGYRRNQQRCGSHPRNCPFFSICIAKCHIWVADFQNPLFTTVSSIMFPVFFFHPQAASADFSGDACCFGSFLRRRTYELDRAPRSVATLALEAASADFSGNALRNRLRYHML